MQLSKQRGFTLIEVVISLAIFSTILCLTYPSFQKTLDTLELHRVLSTFRSDVTLVRQHNMTNAKTPLELRINKNQTSYDVRTTSGNTVILSRTLPTGCQFNTGNRIISITFNSSGNVSQAQTLQLSNAHQTVHLVFSIGLGGLDIRDP